MNTNDKNTVQKETEESKQQAIADAKKNKEMETNNDGTIHTINPFTGTETTITPEDLEGIEKFNEAQTERD